MDRTRLYRSCSLIFPIGLIIAFYNVYPLYAYPPYSSFLPYPSVSVLLYLLAGTSILVWIILLVPYVYTYIGLQKYSSLPNVTKRFLIFIGELSTPSFLVLVSTVLLAILGSGSAIMHYPLYLIAELVLGILILVIPILFVKLIIEPSHHRKVPLGNYVKYWLAVSILTELICGISSKIIDLVISDAMGLLGTSIYLRGWNPGVVDVIMRKPASSIMELTLIPSWGMIISYILVRSIMIDFFTRKIFPSFPRVRI